MFFSYVVGNPPYQEESENKSKTNGQAPRKNVFHHFQIQADEIAEEGSVLVYPGARWMHQSGKGLKQFGHDQMNDCHLSRLEYYPDSADLFSNTSISDGISIVCKKRKKTSDDFQYVYEKSGEREVVKMKNPGDDIIPLNPKDFTVAQKIEKFVMDNSDVSYLHESILPRSLFNIESDFVEKNPNAIREYHDGDKVDYSKEIKLFTNNKAGAAGRSMWFVCKRSQITTNESYIDEWQVVVSSAHAGGQEGRDNQLSIIDNHSAFGRARVALASFKTEKEAKHFFDYCKSNIIKYAFLMTDEALSSLGKKVPHFQSYGKNKYMDFDKNIDEQLAKLIGFTKEEMKYIIDTINSNGPK